MKKIIFCLFTSVVSTVATAQITNGGFETWEKKFGRVTYEDPEGWSSDNGLWSLFGLTCAKKDADAYSGTYALKLKVIDVTGLGVFPAAILLGKLPDTTGVTSGLPFTQRPGGIIGAAKYSLEEDDKLEIHVGLSKWDPATKQRKLIGGGSLSLSGVQDNYTQFHVPITYTENTNPDTLDILINIGDLSQSVANLGSYALIDEIDLGGPAGVREEFVSALTGIYPNPARDRVNIKLPGQLTDAIIEVQDIYGKKVWQGQSTEINTENLARGHYFVHIENKDYSIVKKLILE